MSLKISQIAARMPIRENNKGAIKSIISIPQLTEERQTPVQTENASAMAQHVSRLITVEEHFMVPQVSRRFPLSHVSQTTGHARVS